MGSRMINNITLGVFAACAAVNIGLKMLHPEMDNIERLVEFWPVVLISFAVPLVWLLYLDGKS